MSHFDITNESTEDTFESTDNLEHAIHVARQVARQGQAGDPVCIERAGKTIMQFVLMPNGTVVEQAIA